MNKLSQTRGIGTYAQNLYESIKKYTNAEIEIVKEKRNLKNFDLVHFPFFDIYTNSLPLNSDIPRVVTIHDLIPIQFSKHYPSGIKGKINWQIQKHSLKKIDSIIAVSKTVKQDIVRLLKIQPEIVSVVYSAASEKFRIIQDKKTLGAIRKKYNLTGEFVLYIGNINWNKNILNMTEAVLKSGKELVIIGNAFLDKNNLDHPEKESFKSWLEKYSNEDKIKIIGFVETQEMVAIMNLANCLIFASYYEGFGLPILEAQSCGLPVITSKISATAEIAGEGAILIDPENTQEITRSIEKIFKEKEFKNRLIESGFNNVKRFSWKNTAIETLKVYEKSIKKSN